MRVILFMVFIIGALGGCVKRTISITSAPPQALVWVNDREVGRTPLTFDFTYYGEYDLRVELGGHEPIMTTAWTQRPIWDAPFVDFVAEVAPINLQSNTVWHLDLDLLQNNPAQLMKRATSLRSKTLDEYAK
jgi:hypothetical protein